MRSFFNSFAFLFVLLIVPLYVSCSPSPFQNEEQALQQLRQATKKGDLPPESLPIQIENAYPNTRTAALARLVRARIKLAANDFNGAAALLDSNIFRQKTTVADHALMMRGQALAKAGKFADALRVYEQLVKDFPGSLHVRDARLGWADAAMRSEQEPLVPAILDELNEKNDGAALLMTAKSYETQANQIQAVNFYRRTYFYAAGTAEAKEAEAKLAALASLAPQTSDEAVARADKLYQVKNYAEAVKAYTEALLAYPNLSSVQFNFRRGSSFALSKRPDDAASAFAAIPQSAGEQKAESYYLLARAYGTARNWLAAKQAVSELTKNFTGSSWAPKTLIALGGQARDANNKADESYFFNSALNLYPNAIEIAQAQFELAWLQHDGKNFTVSSQMLTEHLARYANKDTTYRGRAGYWSARDSERAGKIAEACVLYEAMTARYDANWYGYLSQQRLGALKGRGQCSGNRFPAESVVMRAAANLKTVTVAPESAGAREDERIQKADQLGAAGLFDQALDELGEASRTAPGSPRVNMATARFYRQRDENTLAFLALAKTYPDYAQMEPEEMTPEEWDIFYPLMNWQDIKIWAERRNLDPYQIAGLIRQESVFNPRAKSGANAYGLMQLVIPTAGAMARKYSPGNTGIYAETLYNPALNIELGTAYMREQLDKYGRLEYMAAAYNAGPGRVVTWKATLPLDIDEWVEAIPFKETKGYVQGVTRNMLQYRRLYDMDGRFKSNVGSRAVRAMIDSTSPEQLAQEMPELKLKTEAADEEE
ncbi:MAG TPA: transglycosylase SLT domain-containing protein [Pyrinomonadaceae bacterium]|jgi:soluble lytic murein transglycosylase|nr:transglycosylase SLT domain-containing protein [Pyrinomonadaceae bacterium]